MAHGDTLAYLAMKLGGAELSSATLVEEYPSLQTLDLAGCRLKCTNLGPLAPLTTLLHLSLARNRLGVTGQDELADNYRKLNAVRAGDSDLGEFDGLLAKLGASLRNLEADIFTHG